MKSYLEIAKKRYLYLFILTLLSVPVIAQQKLIGYNSPDLLYEGRIFYKTDATILSWPGTSVQLKFKGTEISAVLQDTDTANYFNVIVDGQVISKIHTDTVKRTYLLAENLPSGKHVVQLFKRTEWDKGNTWFYGFEVPDKARVFKQPSPPKRKIEFYGNSITCGYAMEDNSGKDRYYGYFENNYLSYSALTARHFDAQYSCISKSGIGIMVSWFPLIMPEMYDRLNPTEPLSKWDFSKYTPDIVVINLFQNDSWIVNQPDNEQFKNRFGTNAPDATFIINAYKNFVSSLRGKYPDASIICTLGNMDATKEGSPWPGYVSSAVTALNDPKIYTCFFKYKNTNGHPNVAEQKMMADTLIGFIEKNIHW